MGRRKKSPILPPKKPSWDTGMLNDLSESIEHILDLLYPLQYVDTEKYDLLCRKMSYGGDGDLYRELNWWLPQINTLRNDLEIAHYLSTLLPELQEITIYDIDEDIYAQLQKFAGHSFHPNNDLEKIIEYCNKFYK